MISTGSMRKVFNKKEKSSFVCNSYIETLQDFSYNVDICLVEDRKDEATDRS